MGMYTEIYVNTDLKEETPQAVIDVLSAMCNDGSPTILNKDDSRLEGRPDMWATLFSNGSFYTPLTACAKLTKNDIAGHYSLLGKGDIKNYGCEIEQFFDFIKPWCQDEFIGYYRYEEDREPTLVYSDE